MTDVADILEVNNSNRHDIKIRNRQHQPKRPPPTIPANHHPTRAQQLMGISREVASIISGPGSDPRLVHLPSAAPVHPFVVRRSSAQSDTSGALTSHASKSGNNKSIVGNTQASRTGSSVKVGSKWISSKKPARKWAWSPFTSSSRTDGTMFHHVSKRCQERCSTSSHRILSFI
jgi:hypothetical protein